MTEVPLSTVSKDGNAQRAGRGQRHQHEPATPAQPGVGRGERLVIDGQAHRHVGSAVSLQHRGRVVGAGVDDDIRAEFAGQRELLIGDVDRSALR